MRSQIGFLDVVVPPDILVDQSSSDVTVNEGSNVTLKCRARGYPQPEITVIVAKTSSLFNVLSFQWRREDGERIPLAESNGKRYTSELSLLLLHRSTTYRTLRHSRGRHNKLRGNRCPLDYLSLLRGVIYKVFCYTE